MIDATFYSLPEWPTAKSLKVRYAWHGSETNCGSLRGEGGEWQWGRGGSQDNYVKFGFNGISYVCEDVIELLKDSL